MPFRKRRPKNYSYNHITDTTDPTAIKKIFDRAYTRGLKFLSFRPRSEKEIKDFLGRKEFDISIIENVIKLLKEQKFLDDLEFSKWWIEQRQVHRAKGKVIIKQELRQKGIENNTIEQTLQEAQDEYEVAKAFFEKKKHRFNMYSGDEYFQKAAAFLQRRGFSWDIVKKVLKDSTE